MKLYGMLAVTGSFLMSMEPHHNPHDLFEDTPIIFPAFAQQDSALSIARSYDGSQILVGSGHKAPAIKQYDVTTQKKVSTCTLKFDYKPKISTLAQTTDLHHPWLVAAHILFDTSIIDMRTGKEEMHFPCGSNISQLSLTDCFLHAYENSGRLYLWDMRCAKPGNNDYPGYTQLKHACAHGAYYHENGGVLIGYSWESSKTKMYKSLVRYWNDEDEHVEQKLAGTILKLCLSRSAGLAAVSTSTFEESVSLSQEKSATSKKNQNRIVLYKTKNMTERQSLEINHPANSIVFAPKLAYIAAALDDGTVCLWKKKKE